MAGKSGNRFFTQAIRQAYAGDHVFLICPAWRSVAPARARADRKRTFAFTRR
jgi:hypothetical protein